MGATGDDGAACGLEAEVHKVVAYHAVQEAVHAGEVDRSSKVRVPWQSYEAVVQKAPTVQEVLQVAPPWASSKEEEDSQDLDRRDTCAEAA